MRKCGCDFCIENEGKVVEIVHIPPNWTQTLRDGVLASKEAGRRKSIRNGSWLCCIL